MAFSTAPDASAAMAVDLEAEGVGAILGPEEDIDDEVLANLVSASWPTPAVVDDQYGRFLRTPLGGSIVEKRYDAIDGRRMTSVWTTIRGMYDTLCAVPEGTATDFAFLRSRECSGSCPHSQRGIAPSENPAQDAKRYASVTTRTPGSQGAKRTKTTEATQTQQ